jgi:hypothetical protein
VAVHFIVSTDFRRNRLARIVQGWVLGWREQAEKFEMPMRGELPTVTTRAYTRASPVRMGWSRFVAVVSNPELQTVVAFSMIGLLVMLNTIFRFPDFGQTIAQFAQFP